MKIADAEDDEVGVAVDAIKEEEESGTEDEGEADAAKNDLNMYRCSVCEAGALDLSTLQEHLLSHPEAPLVECSMLIA